MKNLFIKNSFYNNIFKYTAIFISIVSIISIGIVYYWSFYHFNGLFEDRIIDEYTLKYYDDIGIKNEWLLGVTTNSVDVLEIIYGEDISNHIHEKALNQEEIYKLYKEKVDERHLIYSISLENKDGGFLYRYSVIKNIYAEIFPKIITSFIFFCLFIIFISYLYIKFLSKQVYSSINKLKEYVRRIEILDVETEPIEILTNDNNIKSLADTFKNLHMKLSEKDKLQKTTLQYISHEMKTPIMIIESYAVSAKDGIFPKETLEASLDTIISQSERMKVKLNSLSKIVKLNTKNMILEKFNLYDFFENIMINYKTQIDKESNLYISISKNIEILADKEKFQILFENLIENQIKYHKSFISIRIFNNNDYLIMLFFNDGEYINKELRKNLFTPFVKGYNGTNGLGLSICKTILLQHKGDINILNTTYGTLFKIKIKIM